MRPDKKKVVDEVWDQDRINSFLDKKPLGPTQDADFSALLYAYRSMRAPDFAKFVSAFTAQARNLDASNSRGQTVMQIITKHRKAKEFVDILSNAGATGP